MDLFSPDDPRPVHFVGIAGAGMSALALLARRRGIPVSGCDADPALAGDVVAAGAQVMAGHDPAHVGGARAVVYTAAVPPDHPELEAARRAGIPVVRRATALAQVVAGATVVGVAGTHGKTTTTVMTTDALAAAGREPTGLAGGRVRGWGGNARLGGTDLFVAGYDSSGGLLYTLKAGGAGVDAGNGVIADGAGGAVVAGHLEISNNISASGADGIDMLITAIASPVPFLGTSGDISNNGTIGLEDVIGILQIISGLRP